VEQAIIEQVFSWKACRTCQSPFVTTDVRRLYCSQSCKAEWYRIARPELIERGREQAREWYHANKERARVRTRTWKRAHPEEVALYEQRRRGRSLGAAGDFTRAQWHNLVAQWCGRCAYCGRSSKLTVDHRIPVSAGGTNTIDNILPACPRCNSRKHDRTEDEFRILLVLDEMDRRSALFASRGLEGS
jgi:5-methylcytosine-specific restriction endonuclease McrA